MGMCARAGLSCQWAELGPVGSGGDRDSCRGLSCPEQGVPSAVSVSPAHLVLWPPPQVIGLLDVFTPNETLDDFTDL